MVTDAFSRAEGLSSSFRFDWPPVRRILIGLLLMAAFTATGAVLLLIVTAIQFQNAVEAPEFDALKISTGWIRQDVTYLEHYWSETAAIDKKATLML